MSMTPLTLTQQLLRKYNLIYIFYYRQPELSWSLVCEVKLAIARLTQRFFWIVSKKKKRVEISILGL
jgi:hypothetical protein